MQNVVWKMNLSVISNENLRPSLTGSRFFVFFCWEPAAVCRPTSSMAPIQNLRSQLPEISFVWNALDPLLVRCLDQGFTWQRMWLDG